MTTELRTYSNELLYALRLRSVPGPRIAEALAEVHSHVGDTGEDPRAAFGPPTDYADELTAALGDAVAPSSGGRGGTVWTIAVYGVGAAVGTWLLLDGVLALGAAGRGSWGLPAAVLVVLGSAALVGLALALRRRARHVDVPILDPRTGEDMTPPLPRWALPVMVCPPLLALVLAAVVAALAR